MEISSIAPLARESSVTGVRHILRWHSHKSAQRPVCHRNFDSLHCCHIIAWYKGPRVNRLTPIQHPNRGRQSAGRRDTKASSPKHVTSTPRTPSLQQDHIFIAYGTFGTVQSRDKRDSYTRWCDLFVHLVRVDWDDDIWRWKELGEARLEPATSYCLLNGVGFDGNDIAGWRVAKLRLSLQHMQHRFRGPSDQQYLHHLSGRASTQLILSHLDHRDTLENPDQSSLALDNLLAVTASVTW